MLIMFFYEDLKYIDFKNDKLKKPSFVNTHAHKVEKLMRGKVKR
jgi:cytosine/adenosine deaminase-related metal-dependent hydrolase